MPSHHLAARPDLPPAIDDVIARSQRPDGFASPRDLVVAVEQALRGTDRRTVVE
jgi:hypothetical protein